MTKEQNIQIEANEESQGMAARIHEFSDEKEFWLALQTATGQAFEGVDEPYIAASGGSSAKVFDYLDEAALKESTVWLVDERYVPFDHTDSNAQLIATKVAKKTKRMCPFDTFLSPDEAADKYEEALRQRLAEEGYLFDVTFLGVGPDGHTASLFPNDPGCEVEDYLVTITQTEEFVVKDRLTLTFTGIELSQRIIVVMIGKGKKDIFDIITNKDTDPKEYPARRLLDWPQVDVFWLNS